MAIAVIVPTRNKICGFCSTRHHKNCAIGVKGQSNEEFPEGRVWLCTCTDEECASRARMKCFTCGNRNESEVNPDTWRCLDVEACEAEVQRRREANPLYAQLREIQEKTDMAKTDTKTAAKKAVAAPKEGKCLCCGGTTKGGDFLPGHDARFVSQRVQAVLDGNETEANGRRVTGEVSANLGAKFTKSLNLARERATKKADADKAKAAAKKTAATKKAAAKKTAAKKVAAAKS